MHCDKSELARKSTSY